MSAHIVTNAAKKAWLESDSVVGFAEWLNVQHNKGFYWGAV